MLLWLVHSTVKLRYNHIAYNDILDVTMEILEPSKSWCELTRSSLLRYIVSFPEKSGDIVIKSTVVFRVVQGCAVLWLRYAY